MQIKNTLHGIIPLRGRHACMPSIIASHVAALVHSAEYTCTERPHACIHSVRMQWGTVTVLPPHTTYPVHVGALPTGPPL